VAATEVNTESVKIRAIKMAVDFTRLFIPFLPLLPTLTVPSTPC
jgi:hypothetical protein